MDEFIPLSVPNFEGNEEKYVMNAVRQGWVSTGGAYITEFEKKMEQYLGGSNVVACQSGTSALHLALIQCGIREGDIVIVPTLTFIAAVNPVRYQSAEPVFMDCDDSLCIDPVKLRKFCQEECKLDHEKLILKKTGQIIKAIIVVHVFGNLADMEQIMNIAEEYHLKVIEDATEALGSKFLTGKYTEKKAGTIGDFSAFSFNGNKIITTGGGGAVVGDNEEEMKHIRYLSTQAKDDPLYYVHNEIGFNYRMTNLQAALGVAQLELLQVFIERKRKNYETYQEYLEKLIGKHLLEFRESTSSNKWFYSFEIPEKSDKELKEVIQCLQERGIQTRPIWGLIHQQIPYKNCIAYEIEKAIYYSKRVINLPCSTNLKRNQIQRVVEELKDIIFNHV